MTRHPRLWFVAPAWGWLPTLALLLGLVGHVGAAAAQPKKKSPGKKPTPVADKKAPDAPAPTPTPDAKPADKPVAAPAAKETGTKKEKNFDFNALDLNGRMRTPQLLYFLERANEELERASLEKRSFIPHMVRSLEEEPL